MMLLEVFPGETEDAFRASLDAALAAQFNPPKSGPQFSYELGGSYKFRGIAFRQIHAIGSVLSVFIISANDGAPRRYIFAPDRTTRVTELVMRGNGQEVTFSDVAEVQRELPT